jgi:hypothetical protein
MIIKRNLFRLLAILTMAATYLPLFMNLMFPLNSIVFYLIIWSLLILIFHHEILLSKSTLFIYIYILIFSFGSQFFWSDRIKDLDGGTGFNFIIIAKEIMWAFLAIVMYKYFLKVKDYKGLAWVSLITFFLIIITSIVTINIINNNPDAVRLSTGEKIISDSSAQYQKMGVGNYSYYIGVIFMFPIFVYYLRNNILSKFQKTVLILAMFLILVSIIKGEFTTTLITSVLFTLIAFMVGKNLKKSLLIGVVFIALFATVLNIQIAGIIHEFSDMYTGSTLGSRLDDLGQTIELRDYNPVSGKTYTSTERILRAYISLQSFLKNPIIGGGDSAGHAHWLDTLALYGILGFFPWILIFRDQIRINSRIINDDFLVYYKLSFLSFILFGLFKAGLNAPQVMLSVFFLIPGMYFLKYIKWRRFNFKSGSLNKKKYYITNLPVIDSTKQ